MFKAGTSRVREGCLVSHFNCLLLFITISQLHGNLSSKQIVLGVFPGPLLLVSLSMGSGSQSMRARDDWDFISFSLLQHISTPELKKLDVRPGQLLSVLLDIRKRKAEKES